MGTDLYIWSAGLLAGAGGYGFWTAWRLARIDRRLGEAETRIALAELALNRRRDDSRALREDMRGLQGSIDALADTLAGGLHVGCWPVRLAPPEGPHVAEGGAAHACTDVAACDRPEACDDGCRRGAGPADTLPIGFDHPDAEEKADG